MKAMLDPRMVAANTQGPAVARRDWERSERIAPPLDCGLMVLMVKYLLDFDSEAARPMPNCSEARLPFEKACGCCLRLSFVE
jgi:hypothetical protein